jgi:CheY-like chemotaxis protein
MAEDDPSNQVVICKLLEKSGHTVTLADNGLKALELLRNEEFDMVLMDIKKHAPRAGSHDVHTGRHSFFGAEPIQTQARGR